MSEDDDYTHVPLNVIGSLKAVTPERLAQLLKAEIDLAAARAERDVAVQTVGKVQSERDIAYDQLAAALENVKDYKENSALFLRLRDEARTELAAARALLRDCLPELDGEGVTIHRVWAALAKETK